MEERVLDEGTAHGIVVVLPVLGSFVSLEVHGTRLGGLTKTSCFSRLRDMAGFQQTALYVVSKRLSHKITQKRPYKGGRWIGRSSL